jgi:predicted RNase H-like HicB family nuclease
MTARRRRRPEGTRRHRPDRSRRTPTQLSLTVIYEADAGGWVRGRLAELPGVITAAPTIKQARPMIRDALGEYLASFGPVSEKGAIEIEALELRIAD